MPTQGPETAGISEPNYTREGRCPSRPCSSNDGIRVECVQPNPKSAFTTLSPNLGCVGSQYRWLGGSRSPVVSEQLIPFEVVGCDWLWGATEEEML